MPEVDCVLLLPYVLCTERGENCFKLIIIHFYYY